MCLIVVQEFFPNIVCVAILNEGSFVTYGEDDEDEPFMIVALNQWKDFCYVN